LNKTEVFLNKPMYVGFSVLDISKTSIYKFHYDVMPTLVNNGSYKLLYTDTDSLIYSIKTEDIYKRIKANLQFFDTSDFAENNPYGIPRVNKKVVGLMKDECSGEPMTEFVGLRSKMYSVRVNGEDRLKKCKGVKSSVVQRTIQFDDYKRCLDNDSVESRVQRTIVPRAHRVYTIEQCKLALSPLDDKRYLVPPSKVGTLPWGHYQSSNSEQHYEGEVQEEVDMDVPAVRQDPEVEDDVDKALEETLAIFEETVAYNTREHAEEESRKRKREEDELENLDLEVLNAIVDVAESMNVDQDCM